MNMQIITPPAKMIVQDAQGGRNDAAQVDALWWRVFDTVRAVDALDDRLASLGSDRNREKSSRASYEPGLLYFLNWAGPGLDAAGRRDWGRDVYGFVRAFPGHRFPGPELVQAYIGHLNGRGLKRSTIRSRYITPLNHYLKALRQQMPAVTGEARDFVIDCKDLMGQSLGVELPKTETAGNLSPLYSNGSRLNVAQVDAVFADCGGDDLIDVRDLALLYVGFNAALRLAELQRMTLNSLRMGDHGWEIHVRGKRNNRQPVPLDAVGYRLIMRWVEAYNGGLEVDDERRIVGEVPIWQPVRKGGHVYAVGDGLFNPARGLSKSAIRDMVGRRTERVLGRAVSPHDMRRTAAAIGRANGMDYSQLKVLLRHKSISTTERYVGNPVNLAQSLLSNVVSWSVRVGDEVAA